MVLTSLTTKIKSWFGSLRHYVQSTWNRYRTLPRWLQIVLGLVALAVLFFIFSSASKSGNSTSEEATLPTVVVSRIDALTGGGGSVSVVGSVRSIAEAEVLAQSGGTVTALHARLGGAIGAGSIIAELDNASQRAAVLQAEGSYDAALAARSGTSATDIAASARNTYTTAYSTSDTLLKQNIDTFFGAPGGLGPQLLIAPSPFDFSYFPKKRQALTDAMNVWREHQATASSKDPQTLLNEAETIIRLATALGNDLSQAATKNGTDATAAQLTALSTARAGFTSLQASITAAKLAYQGQNTSATAGADASVKIALGSLRAAQAQLEKTLVRAPISGTVNFLPIHVGDYVAQLTHVATVAQNGTLEIVAYISEATRAALTVGGKVTVEDAYPGIITSIAPALDPITKQIEMHVALTGKTPLVNGQSVRIALPSETATPLVSTTGPTLLPLTALKLTPSSRVVFSVGNDDRLVSHTVEINDVHGDRIEIKTALPADLEIVIDARGLSDGQKVSVATSTP
ncbi:MAG: Efflux transporter, family [Parcubacteria group bacterium]|nr:Efflux transporter, family [Parcubacteria group bacterium]